MTNFNTLGQFISNFLSTQQNNTAPAPQNATQNAAQGTNAQVFTVKTTVITTTQTADTPAPVRPAPQYDFAQMRLELKALDGGEKSLIIRDLMNLPKEFPEFINALIQKNAKGSENLLLLNQLKAVFQENGKNALNQLMQTISTLNRQGMYQTEQLSEMAKIINAALPGMDTNSAQILKNIILLYLPWLPLGQNINFTLELGNPGEEGMSDSDTCISILIQTENYGLIKIFLMLEDGTKVVMKITCPKEFPQEELQESIKSETKNYNMDAEVNFENAQLQKLDLEGNKPKIDMGTSNQLNPYLLMAAHSIIRLVIEIDKSASLRETRRERINHHSEEN